MSLVSSSILKMQWGELSSIMANGGEQPHERPAPKVKLEGVIPFSSPDIAFHMDAGYNVKGTSHIHNGAAEALFCGEGTRTVEI